MSRGENGGNPTLTEGFFWTPGNYASGAAAPYMDKKAHGAVAIYFDDDTLDNPREAAAVGTRTSNALGLYDISGNVREWCQEGTGDVLGNSRVFLGGSWNSVPYFLQIGGWFNVHNCYYEYEDIGLRLCRTI